MEKHTFLGSEKNALVVYQEKCEKKRQINNTIKLLIEDLQNDSIFLDKVLVEKTISDLKKVLAIEIPKPKLNIGNKVTNPEFLHLLETYPNFDKNYDWSFEEVSITPYLEQIEYLLLSMDENNYATAVLVRKSAKPYVIFKEISGSSAHNDFLFVNTASFTASFSVVNSDVSFLKLFNVYDNEDIAGIVEVVSNRNLSSNNI